MYEKYMYTYIGICIRYAGVDTYVHIYIYVKLCMYERFFSKARILTSESLDRWFFVLAVFVFIFKFCAENWFRAHAGVP
jgi:hypothetical protein